MPPRSSMSPSDKNGSLGVTWEGPLLKRSPLLRKLIHTKSARGQGERERRMGMAGHRVSQSGTRNWQRDTVGAIWTDCRMGQWGIASSVSSGLIDRLCLTEIKKTAKKVGNVVIYICCCWVSYVYCCCIGTEDIPEISSMAAGKSFELSLTFLSHLFRLFLGQGIILS